MNRMLAALILALLIGCGSSEPTVAPLPEGPDAAAVPPAEMRGILEGLRSDDANMQYAALQTLSRFPSVVQRNTEHVRRLEKDGKSHRVREKAAELLALGAGEE